MTAKVVDSAGRRGVMDRLVLAARADTGWAVFVWAEFSQAWEPVTKHPTQSEAEALRRHLEAV